MVCISSNNDRHSVPDTFVPLKTFIFTLESYFFGLHINIILPVYPYILSCTSSFAIFNDILNTFLLLPCALHGRSSHSSNNVRRVQIQLICITQLSASSCFFFPCRAKFAHQPLALTYPQRRFPSAGV
jgi:hypothetical protein